MTTETSRRSRIRVVMLVMAVLASLFAGTAAAASPGNIGNAGNGPSATSRQADPETEALAARADREGSLRLIVQIDRPGRGASVAQHARANGGGQERTFSHMPFVGVRGNGKTIRALARNPHVISIQEDVPLPPALGTTLPVINADQTQALGWTGSGHTVAVLDTGIDADHPFFNDNNGGGASRILAQACFSDPNNAVGDGQLSLCPNGGQTDTSADVDGHAQCTVAVRNCDHGTHVTGIAAGDATGQATAPGNGVAPDANILAIQVFTRHNSAIDCSPNPAPCLLAYQVDTVAGLNQVAVWNGANPGWNIAAANMSLGGGNNASTCDGDPHKAAVDNLLSLGIATVISSGNSGFRNAVGAPGCVSTAVTVGNTMDNDTVRSDSNRGPLLDLFAPGDDVFSSIVDDTYNSKGGTSMSAPHVTGAFAVLREAYPARTIANLLGDMTSTGVPINYDTDGDGVNDTITPRLDLLAAIQGPNQPPTIAVHNATVTVDEGQVAVNSGTVSDPEGDPTTLKASVGSVVDNGDGTWSWSWQTADGPADSQMVTVDATDDKDETSSVSFQLNVDNVAPTVAADPVVTVDEGDTVTVTATFSDPGWLDTHTPDIDWGAPAGHEGELVSAPTLVVTNPGGPGSPRQGTVTGTYRYGDNDDGTGFTITGTVTDKDGGAGSDAVSVTVANVDPSAAIDTSGEQVYNGVAASVVEAGEDVTVPVSATDPGSDDLTFDWFWGDGSSDSTTSLVNFPFLDPPKSPTVEPRDVTTDATHEFVDACLYELGATVTDDDGGTDSDSATIVVTGNADTSKGHGWWYAQYRPRRPNDFSEATLQCYLDIAVFFSLVFNDPLDRADGERTLRAPAKAHETTQFDEKALAAWLNFADGVYKFDTPVDTDGNGTLDSTFGEAMLTAETVRMDPGATAGDIRAQRDILERIILRD